VTSSQPVQTPNALVFTPDNLQCYSYNNVIDASGSGGPAELVLDFQTNSEYINAKFQFSMTQSSGHDFYGDIIFNDVKIVQIKEDSGDVEGYPYLFRLIIPPFTHVLVKIGSNTTGYSYQCNMIGKVYGMTETGFQ